MNLPPVRDRSVLVTGCSSGIGRATALLLHARGWRVIATARKPEDLERLRADGLQAIPLDVADAVSVEHAVRETLDLLGGRLGALVNNAGYGQAGAVEDLSRDVLRHQFEVNVFGLQDLTNRVLPVMLRQGWGRIVHLSSVLGKVTIPMFGSYCAAKHAVEALADVQRVELRGTGVGVMLVEPGPISTEFRSNAATQAESVRGQPEGFARYYTEEIPRRATAAAREPFTRSPEAVARKILHALESLHPKSRYRVTPQAYLAPLMRNLMSDAVYDRVVAKRVPRRGT